MSGVIRFGGEAAWHTIWCKKFGAPQLTVHDFVLLTILYSRKLTVDSFVSRTIHRPQFTVYNLVYTIVCP